MNSSFKTEAKGNEQVQKSDIEKTLLDIEKIPIDVLEKLKSERWILNSENSFINKITLKKDGIVISINENDSDLGRKIICTSDYLIFSYFVAGEEQSLIYNKQTKKYFIIDDLAEDLIDNNSIKVYRDYYDSRGVDDPNYQGHIFEEGEINLKTKSYKKLSDK